LVANKKQRDTAAADAEMKQRKEDQAAKDLAAKEAGVENEAPKPEPEADDGPTDMLAAEEDEDVIF
jgi:V-type H+-transporting ATPase subunit D